MAELVEYLCRAARGRQGILVVLVARKLGRSAPYRIATAALLPRVCRFAQALSCFIFIFIFLTPILTPPTHTPPTGPLVWALVTSPVIYPAGDLHVAALGTRLRQLGGGGAGGAGDQLYPSRRDERAGLYVVCSALVMCVMCATCVQRVCSAT